MAVTLQNFKDYVGTKDATDFPQSCLDAGYAMVVRLIGDATGIPTEVIDQATLIAASEMFHRRNSPQGVSQFADMSGAPVRVGRDPLAAVTPILSPYIGYAV